MIRRMLPLSLFLLLLAQPVLSADKGSVRVQKVTNLEARELRLQSSKNVSPAEALSADETCLVYEFDSLAYRIDGWLVGFELYKSLMNPANSCDNAYPFTITAINFPLVIWEPTTMTVAVDVEAVDETSVPGCTVPGTVLSASVEYEATIDEAGLWDIWVPLDEPLVVNEPFFAGFYFGQITPSESTYPSVLTDADPDACADFNIWSQDIGWVDLSNNSYYNFPGRLVMQVNGVTGASGASKAAFLLPTDGSTLMGQQELRVWDEDMTGFAEYAMFEYSDGGDFITIGSDLDGTDAFRDGVSPATTGTGFSFNWDFSSLPEGNYSLRATLIDTSGLSSSSTIGVYLEPTPPIATITTPDDGGTFCAPLDILMSVPDDNMTFVDVQRSSAADLYSADIEPFSQFAVGDADGDPGDGNPAASGEYGEYYAAPVAGAMAIMMWAERGYSALTTEESVTLTKEDVAERLAELFGTREKLGTYDDAVLAGIRAYVVAHGGGFKVDHRLLPNYALLRRTVEANGQSALLALSGFPGMWVTVDGFDGWMESDSTYQVTIANPMTGTVQTGSWRDRATYSELNLSGYWQKVDQMVSLVSSGWSVARTSVGIDGNGGDGWSVNWSPETMPNGLWFYFRSVGHDVLNYIGYDEVMAMHDCSDQYVAGDYNGDDATDWNDLYYLVEFVVNHGDPPAGGAERADANCDNVINVADIIYYINYLLAGAGTPCR